MCGRGPVTWQLGARLLMLLGCHATHGLKRFSTVRLRVSPDCLLLCTAHNQSITHPNRPDPIMKTQGSNITGILLSRPHGGFRLAKQTSWGDEYVAFAYTAADAWAKLARITGRSVPELKSMQLTRVL